MKSTFKKALAAVSAAAVVATSAAVFTAVPAQALNAASVGQVTVTLEELQANNYQVTVPVSVYGGDGWDSLAFGLEWSTDELTFVSNAAGQGIIDAMLTGVSVTDSGFQLNPAGIGGWIAYTTVPKGNEKTFVTSENPVINITFQVTESAQPGDIYYINGLETSYDGAYKATITHGDEAVVSAPNQGYIKIDGEQTTTTEATTTTTTEATTTTTTTTTEATTTTTTTTTAAATTTTTTTTTAKATTTTTTTTAAATTTSAAATTTSGETTTKAAGTTKAAQQTTKKSGTTGSTSSPRTGSMIPVAGAVAAIAVIGGVALVSKKRK